jgi:hypothetical protein
VLGDSKTILNIALTFSLILKILMGNIMLIMRSNYSFLGVLVLFTAIWDSFQYRSARVALGFSATLIQLIASISRHFGLTLAICCSALVAAQTLVLLWWGAFFIGVISTLDSEFIIPVSLLMLLSLYWITQFFLHCVSFIVGGSMLWYFLRDESQQQQEGNQQRQQMQQSPEQLIADALSSQTLLYLRCALTTSFGSLCKAAIFIAPSHLVLHSRYILARYQQRSMLCRVCAGGVDRMCELPYESARRFHSLSLCQLAVYGRTLHRTAEDQLQLYPETINSSLEETTAFSLGCLSSCIAGSISVLFGLIAERGEVSTWPLFIFVCFCLSYSGAALALSVYSSAVDALIVAAVLSPGRLAQENQLVLLRFLRTSEAELQ